MNKNLTKEDNILLYLEHLDKKTESIITQLEIINQYLYKLVLPKEESLYSIEDENATSINLVVAGNTSTKKIISKFNY